MIAIGVDTHKHQHTAVAISRLGELLGQIEITTDKAGFKQLLSFAWQLDSPVFGIEGAGSWGAGLCEFLLAEGEEVYEAERPERKSRYKRGKSDFEDALSAARKILSGEGLSTPRSRGAREALRVLLAGRTFLVKERTRTLNLIQSSAATAPYRLREGIGPGKGIQLERKLLKMRTSKSMTEVELETLSLLKQMAKRARELGMQVDELKLKIEALVKKQNAALLDQCGVGPICAGDLLVSSPERFKGESAFARANGTAPIKASSGQTNRYRLNRGGDRKVNHCIHTIAIARAKHDPETKRYIEKKMKEGKSKREAMRSLKRHLSRRLYRQLQVAT